MARTKQFNTEIRVRITQQMADRLENEATVQEMTASDIVRLAIKRLLYP